MDERVMAKRYFENKGAKSSKFWGFLSQWRKSIFAMVKIGTDGQTSLKALSTPAETGNVMFFRKNAQNF